MPDNAQPTAGAVPESENIKKDTTNAMVATSAAGSASIPPSNTEKPKDFGALVAQQSKAQSSDAQKVSSNAQQSTTTLPTVSDSAGTSASTPAVSTGASKTALQQAKVSPPVNAILNPKTTAVSASGSTAAPVTNAAKAVAGGAPSAGAPLDGPKQLPTARATSTILGSAITPAPATSKVLQVPVNQANKSVKATTALTATIPMAKAQSTSSNQKKGSIATSTHTNTPLEPTFAITSQIRQVPQHILTLLQTFGPLTVTEISHNIPSTTQSIPAILNIMTVLNAIHFHEGLYYFHNGEVRGDTVSPYDIVDLINDTNAEIGETKARIELLKKELNQNVKVQNRARSARVFLKDLVAKYDGVRGIRGDPVYATALKTLNVDLGMKRKMAAAETAKKKRSTRKKRKTSDPPKQNSTAALKQDVKAPVAKSDKDVKVSSVAVASSKATNNKTSGNEIKVLSTATVAAKVPAKAAAVPAAAPIAPTLSTDKPAAAVLAPTGSTAQHS
jgi:hypothetical protein